MQSKEEKISTWHFIERSVFVILISHWFHSYRSNNGESVIDMMKHNFFRDSKISHHDIRRRGGLYLSMIICEDFPLVQNSFVLYLQRPKHGRIMETWSKYQVASNKCVSEILHAFIFIITPRFCLTAKTRFIMNDHIFKCCWFSTIFCQWYRTDNRTLNSAHAYYIYHIHYI